MAIHLTPQQQEALTHDGHLLVLGMPGTGKTTLLHEKIAQLLERGTRPEDIGVAAFAWRNLQHTRALLEDRLGKRETKALRTGTLVDFALQQLQTDPERPIQYCSNTQVRRFIRQAIKNTAFEGTVNEAEHVIRQFKGRSAKPKEHEPHVTLFQSYQDLLVKAGMIDRHDMMRKHLVGMRNETVHPPSLKYLILDNIQDATQIQLLWLIQCASEGTKLILAGDDDLCVFFRSGALGPRAVADITEALPNVKQVMLTQNFRLGADQIKAALTVLKDLGGDRIEKTSQPKAGEGGAVKIVTAAEPHAEMALLVANVKSYLERHPKNRVGVVVRHDLLSRQVSYALTQAKIYHADFARSLWDNPSATLVLDILEVLLDTADNSKLRNVFAGYGITTNVFDQLVAAGLKGEKWLKLGAAVPAEVDIPLQTQQEIARVRRRMINYYKLLAAGHGKKVFKAAVADAIELMNEEDRVRALYGLEALLSLKGKLSEQLEALRQQTEPDPMAQVLVAPTREVRNMEFDCVFMPFACKNVYPYPYKVMGVKHAGDRRKFYLAMTRARSTLIISYNDKPSPYVKDIEAALGTKA